MGAWDWLILALLAAAATIAVVRLRRRKSGGCNGNCACCPHCSQKRRDD